MAPAAIDPFASATAMLAALRARTISAVELLELHQETVLAGTDMQRVEGLHLAEPLSGNVALAKWRHAEVDEGMAERRRAETAAGRARRG